jgi:hydroxymethylbilane synthase
MRKIRIGSRDSALAVRQSRIVMDMISARYPDLSLELITMKTSGDRLPEAPLDGMVGKGLFTRELDAALRAGRVDICVHSLKDLPLEDDPDLPLAAVSPRADPRDVLILPAGAREGGDVRGDVGCSSLRRRAQLQALFPDWSVRPVRGNILTRLSKLDSGEYGALVLAAAGILRLELWARVSRAFSTEEMLPAACQGILAVQGRAGDDLAFLDAVHDEDTWRAARAERAFLRATGGGCSSPNAAYARFEGGRLVLAGFYVPPEGPPARGEVQGAPGEAEALGLCLARALKGGGAVG